jgi:hypothetical protein
MLAAKALSHGEAAVNGEPLAPGHVRDSQQEHDLVYLPGGRAGIFFAEVETCLIVPCGACATPP